MKKIIYAFVLALTIGFSLSSCTEEKVEPTTGGNGGGNTEDPIKR